MELVMFLAGVFVGGMIMCLENILSRASGVLKIDQSDPEKDRYLFDVGDLDKLKNKRKIILKIEPNADISQK